MSSGPDPSRREDVPLDDLIQSMFDRDLPLDARDHLFETLDRDPAVAREAARTQRVLSLLAGPVPGPDLSSPILDRLERKGVIVSRRSRRFVALGRVAAMVALGGAALTIAMIQRTAPETVGIRSPGAPLANVADAGQQVGASAADAIGSIVARVTSERAAADRPDRARGMVAVERSFIASRDVPRNDRLVRELSSDRGLSLPTGAAFAAAPRDGLIVFSGGAPSIAGDRGMSPVVGAQASAPPRALPGTIYVLPVDPSVQPQLMPVLGQFGGVWLGGADAWPRGLLRQSSPRPDR